MSYVYIAYSREDKAYASRLANRLQEAGVNVWFDQRIDYGAHWWGTVADAIGDCTAFVLIMTPDSEHSSWVEREIAVAQRAEKPLFPLLLRGRTLTPVLTEPYTDVTSGNLPPDEFFARVRHLVKPTGGMGRNVVPPVPDFRTRALPPDKSRLLPPPRRRRRTIVLAVIVALIVIALLMFTGSRSASGQASILADLAGPQMWAEVSAGLPGQSTAWMPGVSWSGYRVQAQDGLGR